MDTMNTTSSNSGVSSHYFLSKITIFLSNAWLEKLRWKVLCFSNEAPFITRGMTFHILMTLEIHHDPYTSNTFGLIYDFWTYPCDSFIHMSLLDFHMFAFTIFSKITSPFLHKHVTITWEVNNNDDLDSWWLVDKVIW